MSARRVHPIFGCLLVSATLSVACGAEELGDEPNSQAECQGKCDGMAASGTLPVAVRSATWDGRVVIASSPGGDLQCRVMAVRPTRITVQGDAVQIPPAVFSNGVDCGAELGTHAIAMTPGLVENPFQSNADGAPDPEGAHRTYAIAIVSTEDGDDLPTLTWRRATVTVVDAEGDTAEISAFRWDGEAVPLRTTGGAVLLGSQPTLTADGGLLVFLDEATQGLVYARLVDPSQPASGFTTPAPITSLFTEADVIVDGLRLADRYPLAARQLRGPDGRAMLPGQTYFGAYPWLSQDGADLFHTSTMAGAGGRRAGSSVIGQGTRHGLRHLDGPINPSRNADTEALLRESLVAAGRSQGFHAPYREARTIPRQRRAPTYPVFAAVTEGAAPSGSYHEVDFEVVADEDFVVFLPMNENISTASDFVYDLSRTPDISGNFNTAELLPGAAFPLEELGTDANPGPRGRAMYFADGGGLRVASSPTLSAPSRGLAVSLFVQRLATTNGTRSLVDWPGVARLELGADGSVRGTVFVGGQARTLAATTTVPMQQWTHVGLTYDAPRGALRMYVNGNVAGQATGAAGTPSSSAPQVTIGPVSSGEPGDTAILALDEVALSRVLRTDFDMAWAARRQDVPTQANAGAAALAGVVLPLGLDPRQLDIPPWGPLQTEAIELGRRLFFDPRMSRNGQMACATCHNPEFAFTDGLAVGRAIDGTNLQRASPTVFNRAFSSAQFWDSRARTLEAQALSPIGSAREHNFTIEEAVALVASSPEYVQRFRAAYNRAPDRNGLANAIAAFERAMLAGDSPVDRFEAGELDALTEQEQRGRVLFHGKARCVACHSGSNYTDELLHRLALPTNADRGAFFVTNGRTSMDRAFKTPSLRNIDVTGPYFHDGSAETLEEVVELYDEGPTVGAHDWEIRPLGLTAQERDDLVAFLRALTSPNATTATTPPELPALGG